MWEGKKFRATVSNAGKGAILENIIVGLMDSL